MTTALPAQPAPPHSPLSDVRHLRLVGATPQSGTGDRDAAPLVGYLLFVPEGTDPAELFVKDGVRPELRPVTYDDSPPALPASGDSIHVDTARHVAQADGRELDLTYLEFELLAHLVLRPHQVHSREQLVANVWGYDHVGDGRTVDVHIARLRRKLGKAHQHRIVTVRRVGYKYVPDQQASPDAASCGRP
ncbi:winged helix-turn-helix domain-containing protein [Streptomyces sp. ActVer]|uniref:winged helix-turn-helix domain-containing protein n=1 Tax=Streptomyces sp. ActVer TaxID=3014558 RepID=UPI0022B4AD10|nr:winged helix-turn-helix domain-containing protein [Streptomyces sp. ActVer]MCZ4516120.1 winged helix-turn-helix domain-containing protein [Streptomyces sp. ActVer]